MARLVASHVSRSEAIFSLALTAVDFWGAAVGGDVRVAAVVARLLLDTTTAAPDVVVAVVASWGATIGANIAVVVVAVAVGIAVTAPGAAPAARGTDSVGEGKRNGDPTIVLWLLNGEGRKLMVAMDSSDAAAEGYLICNRDDGDKLVKRGGGGSTMVRCFLC